MKKFLRVILEGRSLQQVASIKAFKISGSDLKEQFLQFRKTKLKYSDQIYYLSRQTE